MIEVAAQGDFVTLRGTVETLRERHAAIDDARQIDGVREIDDQLALELGGSDRRGDEDPPRCDRRHDEILVLSY